MPAARLSAPGRFLWSVGPPIVRGLARALYSTSVGFETELPDPPFVLAANHYSHLDPPVIGSVVGSPVRYLAVDELQGKSFLLDRVLDLFGTIPLSRSSVPLAGLRAALGVLESGEIVGVFPEGARVARWGERTPKNGAAWLAIRAGVPLVPIAVTGTDRALDIDNHWHRARIAVNVGSPLTADSVPGLTEMWAAWIEHTLTQSSS